jgi:hypothetical protein
MTLTKINDHGANAPYCVVRNLANNTYGSHRPIRARLCTSIIALSSSPVQQNRQHQHKENETSDSSFSAVSKENLATEGPFFSLIR